MNRLLVAMQRENGMYNIPINSTLDIFHIFPESLRSNTDIPDPVGLEEHGGVGCFWGSGPLTLAAMEDGACFLTSFVQNLGNPMSKQNLYLF